MFKFIKVCRNFNSFEKSKILVVQDIMIFEFVIRQNPKYFSEKENVQGLETEIEMLKMSYK